MFSKLVALKKFNYEKIYLSPKLEYSVPYFSLVLNGIFDVLKNCFFDRASMLKICPDLINDFYNWLAAYWDLPRDDKFKNDPCFVINDIRDFSRAAVLYISGMTDNYAMSMYEKIIGFN
jgi:dGTPase